jgi:5'(3')-deoxyribonucleotidase
MQNGGKQKILAVDLYSTLADVNTIMCELVKRDFGHNVKIEDITDWNYIPRLVGDDQCWAYFREIWTDHVDKILPVDPNCINALYQALGQGYSIRIITSTQRECLPNIVKWLDDWKVPYDALIAIKSGPGSKWQFEFNAIIDDAPSLAKDALKYPDRKCFLIDSPWNRDINEGVIRVKSFAEMIQELE